MLVGNLVTYLHAESMVELGKSYVTNHAGHSIQSCTIDRDLLMLGCLFSGLPGVTVE